MTNTTTNSLVGGILFVSTLPIKFHLFRISENDRIQLRIRLWRPHQRHLDYGPDRRCHRMALDHLQLGSVIGRFS
jgi:hypothetical protein